MKLDKAQRNYALERIQRAADAAIAKHKVTPPKRSDAEIKVLLEDAGFVVNSNYCLSYIQPAMSVVQKQEYDAAVAAADIAIANIRVSAQAAKDNIMLADSEQALAILTEFTEQVGS